MRFISRKLLLGSASVVLGTAALYGCKNFLTDAEQSQGTLNSQTLETQSGLEGTLIAAYRTLDCTYGTSNDWGCAVSNWVWGNIAGDDSYKGSTSDDQPGINDIEGYHWGGARGQSYINTKWTAVYEGVVRANATLNLLDLIQKDKPGLISAGLAAAIHGEALFLRAHYHFEAFRMWGNIPYYRAQDNDYYKANEDSAAVVADLLVDLDSAVSLLQPTPWGNADGRADQWTAKAYRGRVEAYAAGLLKDPSYWDKAIADFEDVKNNGPYALEQSFDRVWTGFKTYQNGPETIFAYQASVNDGNPDGENSNYGERLNFPYSGSHFGCCGFNQPTQNLVNFYRVDAAGLPLSLSAPATWNSSDATLKAGDAAAVDPRLDWTVGRDGVPYKDWGPMVQSSWVRDVTNGGPYTPKKNAHEAASGAESNVGWQNTQLNAVHIHIFRYADLLLMLAEGYVEKGRLEDARAIVNMIRTRAGVTAQGCGLPSESKASAAEVAEYPQCAGDARMAVPIDDPSITWANYKIGLYTTPWTDQTFARDAVRAERRLELGVEGQRFFDLRRWGIEDSLNAFINGVGGGAEKSRRPFLLTAEPVTSKHHWFPIPDLQIQLSTVNGQTTLAQNPGW